MPDYGEIRKIKKIRDFFCKIKLLKLNGSVLLWDYVFPSFLSVKKTRLLFHKIVPLINVHFNVLLEIFPVYEIQNYLNHSIQPHKPSNPTSIKVKAFLNKHLSKHRASFTKKMCYAWFCNTQRCLSAFLAFSSKRYILLFILKNTSYWWYE